MTACPNGWHLPSDGEWKSLVNFAGYDCYEATPQLMARNGWGKNGGNGGEDTYGFSALPGGFGSLDGRFGDVGAYGLWWIVAKDADRAYKFMDNRNACVFMTFGIKPDLYSVRCVKDD